MIKYFVGARRSGKTTKIIEIAQTRKNSTILVSDAHTRKNLQKEYPSLDIRAATDSIDVSGDVFVINFIYVATRIQKYLLTLALAEQCNLYAEVQPCYIDAEDVPPFWKYWQHADIEVLNSKLTNREKDLLRTELSPDDYITQIEGRFIYEPRRTD